MSASLINHPSDPSPGRLQAMLDAALAAARGENHRRLIVLAGGRDWTRRCAALALDHLAGATALWLGEEIDAHGCRAVPAGKAAGLLGAELELLVFDAYAGFDPDAFGAAIGGLRGGGLMLLLTPPLGDWPAYADPERARITVAPYGPEAVGGRFLTRLAQVLRAEPAAIVAEEGRPLPTVAVPGGAVPSAADQADQQAAVTALVRVVEGHRRRPVVLLADRGRGKSASLGLAAARLMGSGRRTIVITGPRLDAVEAAFRHAAEQLPQARRSRGELRCGDSVLRFVAPDALADANGPANGSAHGWANTWASADLVLVDEAAAIPTPLLVRLLSRYPRIAFASTVHGYEGTGRGFTLRFTHALDTRTPGWRLLRLHAPMRWAAGDPLERLGFRALLLDAEAADDNAVEAATVAAVSLQRVDRDALAADEVSLRELFGLLLLAHYRTRPFDLRQLLDGPNLELWLLRHRGHVAGAALVAAEGGLDAGLGGPVCRGERRLRGHLIPQSLAAHLGLPDAVALRCARIMRIAIHPACQRRGLGAALLAAIADNAASRGVDLIGASFGGTAALAEFWSRQGVLPVRIGVGREAVSGEHSIMVLRPLSSAGRRLHAAARRHFRDNLPHQLAEPLRALDADLVTVLFGGLPAHAGWRLRAAEIEQLRWFARGGRSYEDSLAALWKLACLRVAAGGGSADSARSALLIMKLLQRRDWRVVGEALGYTGRAQGLAALRAAVGESLAELG